MVEIAVLGGSFDPVHLGHLEAAKAILRGGFARKVLLVPAAQNPHKQKRPGASAEHRLQMLRIALAEVSGAEPCEIELHRPPPSYTFETVMELEGKFGEVTIGVAIGPDILQRIEEWKNLDYLVSRVHWLVLENRPGFHSEGMQKLIKMENCKFSVVDNPAIAVSSSTLRRMLAAGKDCSQYLPEEVYAYIREHGIYSPGA